MFPATRLLTIVRVRCAQSDSLFQHGCTKSTTNPAFMQDKQDCRRPNVWRGLEMWRKHWLSTEMTPTVETTFVNLRCGIGLCCYPSEIVDTVDRPRRRHPFTPSACIHPDF